MVLDFVSNLAEHESANEQACAFLSGSVSGSCLYRNPAMISLNEGLCLRNVSQLNSFLQIALGHGICHSNRTKLKQAENVY